MKPSPQICLLFHCVVTVAAFEACALSRWVSGMEMKWD